MAFTKRTVHEVDERSSPSLYKLLRDFLEAYKERTRQMKPPMGETSTNQRLDAIIEMLSPLGGVPSQQALDSNRLEIIHGLVAEIKESLPRKPGPPAKVESVKFVFAGLKES